MRICDDLISERETLRAACAKLARARYDQPLVPIEFAGIDSELDDLPNYATNPAEKARISDLMAEWTSIAKDAAGRLRAALIAALDEEDVVARR